MKAFKQKIDRLVPGSDAWAIANLYQNSQQNSPDCHAPLLVIVNDAYTANRLIDEIRLFNSKLRVSIFNDHEVLPYERLSPSKDIIANRLTTLWQISYDLLDIVIVQLTALQTKICPKEYLNARVMLLKIGDKISTTNLRHNLVSSDYTNVEQVYESGEFAIRGGIIDIMPMGSKQIVRIDLFDDEIDSLKILDYKTKETVQSVSEYQLMPAREYPTDKNALHSFIDHFKNYFFKNHFSQPQQHNNSAHIGLVDSDLLRELNNGLLPPGSEFYLPLFFEYTASLFDYLDDKWQIVYFQDALQHLNLNWQDINRRYNLCSSQYPCLKPIELFLTVDSFFGNIRQFNSFEIQQSGELNSQIKLLQDIAINNKLADPLTKLKQFKHSFAGKIVIVLDSLGRTEIVRKTLDKHGLATQVVNDLSVLINENSPSSISTSSVFTPGVSTAGGSTLGASILSGSVANNLYATPIYLIKAVLYNGFIVNNIAFITEQELYKFGSNYSMNNAADSSSVNARDDAGSRGLGGYSSNRRRHKNSNAVESDAIIRDLSEIEVGDYVVHINHGVAKYLGLSTQTISDIEYEMLELEYQNESRLFIPVNNLHLISRYKKSDSGIEIKVNQLGSAQWGKIKDKALKKIDDMAAELLELYAQREMQQGNKFILPDEYPQFAESFMYQPTDDQVSAIDSIIKDMLSIKPMDRLICGDVGFGKTEVAIRAAFICAMNGRQVAVLAPTTLLTEQHYQNFLNRFAGFPINIAEISRFKTKQEITQTLELAKAGKVDIIIGTHRLIQNDVQFANLGLVIIDEEHRFGVKQKEKLKQLRANIDFLAMTATPIPRTLSMAMEGLRDFSIIATPPKRRLAINTIVAYDEDRTLREAVFREISRGGQVFFLYNDVENIDKMYQRLTKLIPEAAVTIAHGQMNEHQLEESIRSFIKQRFHILLCSTIIETGIDIANANTIIIYRADKLGLAQLYQLRGRVGRSHHQAYCYLVIPENVTSNAEKRLDAIKMTTELGSGFNLAVHDLEIRGAGEILGDSQSGNIRDVGLSLYTEMLKKAINKLKLKVKSKENITLEDVYCEVNLNTTTILPTDYCPDVHERLVYYKRFAKAETINEIDLIYQNVIDHWGLPPQPLQHLVEMHYLRIKSAALGVQKLDATDKQINIIFSNAPKVAPDTIIGLLQKLYTCKFDGKNKLTWAVKLDNAAEKISKVNYILDELAK